MDSFDIKLGEMLVAIVLRAAQRKKQTAYYLSLPPTIKQKLANGLRGKSHWQLKQVATE